MARFEVVSPDREPPAWVEPLVAAFSDAEPGLEHVRKELQRAWSELAVARHPAAMLWIARRHWLLDPVLSGLRDDLERLGFEVEGSPPAADELVVAGADEQGEWELDPELLGWKPRRQQLLRGYRTPFGVEVDAYNPTTRVAAAIEWDASGRSWAGPGYPWRQPSIVGIDADWLVCATPLYDKTIAPLREVWSPGRVAKLGTATSLRGVLVIDA